MDNKTRTRKSKHLSLILRHNPGSVGLTLDSSGWVPIEELVKAASMTTGELYEIVNTDQKKRYEFNGDKIRACQGHSVEVDLGYEATQPPELLYHGTSGHFLEIILKEGLRKMDRHHVHLSADTETAIKVAKRRPLPHVLLVKARNMFIDGHTFYLSTNGVWLTDRVPVQYLSKLD